MDVGLAVRSPEANVAAAGGATDDAVATPPAAGLMAGDPDAPPAITFDLAIVDAEGDAPGDATADASSASGTGVGAEAEGGDDPRASAAADDDAAQLESVLESLLLAAGQPVPLAKIVDALDGPDRGEVAAALGRLAERYEREGRGLRVVHVAGGWQLRSAAQHGPYVRRLLGGKPPRLTRPMLETLAIVAYRQPCTRPEIEAIRGVDCDAALTSLLERRMVRIEGRKEAPGRPLLYGTTREFLEVFGLPDLQALPPIRDLGEHAELLAAQDMTVSAAGVAPTAEAIRDAAAVEAAPSGGEPVVPDAGAPAAAADRDDRPLEAVG